MFFVVMALFALMIGAPLVYGPSLLIPGAVAWTLMGLVYKCVMNESELGGMETETLAYGPYAGQVYYMLAQEPSNPSTVPQIMLAADLGWHVFDSYEMWMLAERHKGKDSFTLGMILQSREWMVGTYRVMAFFMWGMSAVMLVPVSIPQQFTSNTVFIIRTVACVVCFVVVLLQILTRVSFVRKFAVAIHISSPILPRILKDPCVEPLRKHSIPKSYMTLMVWIQLFTVVFASVTMGVNVNAPGVWIMCYIVAGLHMSFFTFWWICWMWQRVWDHVPYPYQQIHPGYLFVVLVFTVTASILYIFAGSGDLGCAIAGLVLTCIGFVLVGLLRIC
jgi:hypothetical protein